MKKTIILIGVILVLLITLGQLKKNNFNFSEIVDFLQSSKENITKEDKTGETKVRKENKIIVEEESVIIDVIDKTLPSVVTIGIKKATNTGGSIEIDPFDPFTPFRRIPGQEEVIERNIGSGFIISENGLVITNRHVVGDDSANYEVLTNSGKKYVVKDIYRDPLNDLAILKIDADNLKPLELADSSQLKLGQIAVAIGTPLGEFTNTVTTGIVSGLGRGIRAGSPLEGLVEQLDNVIQTDAAINPGNSGGPLLNSSGQVIGVNTAVSGEGQNIGFAIPSNVVANLIENFEARGGSFERPFIGVRYRMIDEQTALANDLIEGAQIIEVIQGSPADEAGIQPEDIINKLDGQELNGEDQESLAKIILQKKVGDKISVTIWRDGEIIEESLTLEAFE
jgi:S1-C subfamily serine protease